jgi:hypothetical protein
MKEIPFNPRIFLITAIVNLICAGLSLVCGIVLLSMGGSGGFVPVYVFVTIIFSQIALLAGWQYRATRALDEKFKNLQESLGRREELPAK